MSEETCLRPRDPVELLLKNILRNTLICAGVWSLVGCGSDDAGVAQLARTLWSDALEARNMRANG